MNIKDEINLNEINSFKIKSKYKHIVVYRVQPAQLVLILSEELAVELGRC